MASDSMVGENLAHSPFETLYFKYHQLLEAHKKLQEDYECLCTELSISNARRID